MSFFPNFFNCVIGVTSFFFVVSGGAVRIFVVAGGGVGFGSDSGVCVKGVCAGAGEGA